ncbi:MAG: DUF3263 domain-containing protein [Actinomycetota bacterium]|nr:DUF3263 domain-containing protein [Actinomycetota bacterium]
MELSDRDRAILDFEGSWWTEPGPKKDAIRSYLALSSTRYYRILGVLAETPEAAAYQPLVVHRLRRLQARRRRERFEGRPVSGPPTGERPLR